jgi:hypothetical protein
MTIFMKKQSVTIFTILSSLIIITNMKTSLAEISVQNGDPIGKVNSGETIYFEPEHVSLPEPKFYPKKWIQLPSTVDKKISIKYAAFERKGNEVFYDALLSDKRDGFQEVSRFKVMCSPPDNIWPSVKIDFFLMAYKKKYSDDWSIHKNWPKIKPEWRKEENDPSSSGEPWLFVHLAETVCHNF